MSFRRFAAALGAALLLGGIAPARGDDSPSTLSDQVKQLQQYNDNLEHRLDQLSKQIDDLSFQIRLSDVAEVDKWFITGPPPAHVKNPTGPGATNPVKFWTYSFVPKDRKPHEKLPLLVLPHGGVHADFTTYHLHILRELMAQGYVVIAPEYRGSTGYGRGFYEQIDYGGLEVEDCRAAKEWAVRNFEFVDPSRVGLVGWSHGGLIVLMEAFEHPKDYACVFAGMPVSDLIQRAGYAEEDYRSEFSAPYHIGKTVRQDIKEYERRSPAWHADKLEIPLLIHTNTNDDDVNVMEVEHLIQALKAAGKKFEYKIYQDGPGGHSFDRIDTFVGREARKEIWEFLARYLHPPRPIRMG